MGNAICALCDKFKERTMPEDLPRHSFLKLNIGIGILGRSPGGSKKMKRSNQSACESFHMFWMVIVQYVLCLW